MDRHFISYASADGQPYARRLHDELIAAGIPVWMDETGLHPGLQWPHEIEQAILNGESLLYVLTRGSGVTRGGERRDVGFFRKELSFALEVGKPVFVLRMEHDVVAPIDVIQYQSIAFDPDFEDGLQTLIGTLGELTRPIGMLRNVRQRLAYDEAKLKVNRDPAQRRGIADRMDQDRKRVAELEAALYFPQETLGKARQRIADGQAGEQRPSTPVEHGSGIVQVSSPPWPGSAHFRNRTFETQQLDRWLQGGAVRLVAVFGRAGIGKTAMVCRLLRQYCGSPDESPPDLAGIVYLSAERSPAVGVATLLDDLGQVLPEKDANRLRLRLGDGDMPVQDSLDIALEALAGRRVVVMIDAFDLLVDRDGGIRDQELDELLRSLLQRRRHGVTVVVTTSKPLAVVQAHRGRGAEELQLGKVPKDAAEQILRELDRDGLARLKDAPSTQLERAWSLTDGNPQALEAVYHNLRTNPHLTLPELLDGVAGLVAEEAAEALVGKAFNSLDGVERMVVQGLALYGQPVSQAAVEHLLEPYLGGIPLARTLDRLVSLHYVRPVDHGITVGELDKGYALARVPYGSPEDRGRPEPPFTQLALLHRGAEYFFGRRIPTGQRTCRKDLEAEQLEFDLRRRGEEYNAALEALLAIDEDLLRWGHARLVLKYHKTLLDHLPDPRWARANLDALGAASRRLGDFERARSYYEEALALVGPGEARERLSLLVNLANTDYAAADLKRAVGRYTDALGIAATLGRRYEPAARGGLCLCRIETGRFAEAETQHREVLSIVRELGRSDLEASQLARGGYLFKHLGRMQEALDAFDQARAIAGERRELSLEVRSLEGRAAVLLDNGDDQAVEEALQAVELADQVGYPALLRDANYVLALAHLRFDGRVGGARDAIRAAVRNIPSRRRRRRGLPVLALEGVIAWRAGNAKGARDAFGNAKGLAEAARPEEQDDFGLLDAQGLALAGLVLCGDRHLTKSAVAAYRLARSITPGEAVWRPVLRLLDDLDPDRTRALTPIRTAASNGGTRATRRQAGPSRNARS